MTRRFVEWIDRLLRRGLSSCEPTFVPSKPAGLKRPKVVAVPPPAFKIYHGHQPKVAPLNIGVKQQLHAVGITTTQEYIDLSRQEVGLEPLPVYRDFFGRPITKTQKRIIDHLEEGGALRDITSQQWFFDEINQFIYKNSPNPPMYVIDDEIYEGGRL